MRILWAPWRMKYILAPKAEGCFLCEAARRREDGKDLVVYRGERTFAIMNKYPYNTGHILIAPYRHVPSLVDLDDEELKEMGVVVKLMLRTLSTAMSPDGFNIGVNIGRVAGAGVEDHVHVHVVPRWCGDTNFMPVVAETKVIPEALEDTYRRIRRALEQVLAQT